MDSKNGNPFPGLRSFHAEENELFFGRDSQRNELLRRLKRNRLMAVIGSSGSGKSSLIKAGLIPVLRRGFRTRGGSDWHIATITPGDAPIARLAVALSEIAALGDSPRDLAVTMTETTLRRSALGLVEVVRQGRLDGNVLVLVDQFEELFRVKPNPGSPHLENEAAAFVNLMLEAAQQEALPIYVVLTMRSDYLGDCARFNGLPEAINRGQYLIPRLTREQRREVILGPVALRGREISQRLVHRLLNDVGDNPDQLPILQHALMRTWEYWEQNAAAQGPIDLEHYEAIGTMAAALERHADQAYHELDDAQQHTAELLFKRLTEKRREHGEDRHPAAIRDICAVTELSLSELTPVVDCFRGAGRSFLMPGMEKELNPDVILDISHESLIRVWRRLRRWVEQEAAAAAEYLRLVERMEDYRAAKDSLLVNPALQLALNWRAESDPNRAWAERYDPRFDEAMTFLNESREHHLQEKAKRKAAARRELEQAQSLAREQRQRLIEQQRAAKRMRIFSVAISLVGIMAIVFAVWAYIQGERAAQQARRSQSWELATAAINTIPRDSELSVLLALKAVEINRAAGEEVTSEAQNALNRALESASAQPVITGHEAPVVGAFFTSDGARIVTASEDGSARVWSVATRNMDRVISVGAPITAADLSVDDEYVVLGTTRGEISLWTLDGRAVHRRPAHDGPVSAVKFSPDGARIASSGRDAHVRLWDTVTGDPLFSMQRHTAPVVDLAFKPDGSLLASAGWDTNVVIWDTATGDPQSILEDHDAEIESIVFSPDGALLASAGWDTDVKLWNVTTGEPPSTLTGHQGAVVALAFSPDGARLASGGWDNMVRLWDVPSGRETYVLRGHTQAVTELAFSPGGRHLAAAGWESTTRLWDLSTNRLWRTQQSHNDWINALAFNPAGTLLVSAGDDKAVVVWDVTPNKASDRLPGFQPWQGRVAFLHRLIATVVSGEVQILDAASGEVIHRITGIESVVDSLAFSDDGKQIAVADIHNTVNQYYLDIEDLVRVAQDFVTRNLTQSECETYLHSPTCR